MRENEIKQYLKMLNVIEKTRAKRPTIEWETDIEKMDFSKLYSLKNDSREVMDIPKHMETKWLGNDKKSFNMFDWERFADLSELVLNGEKIIPPMYNRDYVIRNGEKMIFSYYLFDGMHREEFSKAIGLKQIPIVVFERVSKYQFSVSKWNFIHDGDFLAVKSNTGNDTYTFDLKEWIPGISDKCEYFELIKM